jgi:predicted ATPase
MPANNATNLGRPIKAISLRGYKSFRDLPRFALRPGLNVLLGSNGSGKTNFIRFFEMLGHMMDPNLGLQNYVSSRGRADAFLFRGEVAEMSAHLWFANNEYLFTLQADETDRSFFFKEEAAPLDGLYGKTRYSQGSGHRESPLAKQVGGYAGERFAAETLRDWRVYHFHDTSASANIMKAQNVVDNERLQRDAGNLAPFLLRMRDENRHRYDYIVSEVRAVAPFFGDFVLEPIGKDALQTQLRWREKYSPKIFYPSQFSDGTLRFICLATLLLQPTPPSTLIIDEPELGLHPQAISQLASLLKTAADSCQVIVSTQSTPLVDELSVEDLIVVQRQDGASTLARLSPEQLAPWLEEYTLGQLVRKNVIDASPSHV